MKYFKHRKKVNKPKHRDTVCPSCYWHLGMYENKITMFTCPKCLVSFDTHTANFPTMKCREKRHASGWAEQDISFDRAIRRHEDER